MLTPEYLAEVAEASAAQVAELHDYILKRIIQSMAVNEMMKKPYQLTPKDKYMIEALEESGIMYADIIKYIATHTRKMEKTIKAAFNDAGAECIKYDDMIYKSAGLTPQKRSPYVTRLMERNYRATAGTFMNMCRSTAEASQTLFLRKCDEAYSRVASGAVSYTEAYAEAVDSIGNSGVVVQYPTGHRDTIETATLRCVRTGISQMTGDITMQRMEEMDWDIILVSSHLGARVADVEGPENHAWWQGKFYTRTGKNPQFPDFYEATGYGTGEGLCGWNCRHSYGPGDGKHNNFEQFDSDENKKRYELEQRQRQIERTIRHLKQRIMAIREGLAQLGESEGAKKLIQKEALLMRHLEAKNAAYRDFCSANGLRTLEERLKVNNW